MNKQILSGREARVYLAVSSAEMQRLLEEGEIRAFRRGKRWCIPVVELDRYIERMVRNEKRA